MESPWFGNHSPINQTDIDSTGRPSSFGKELPIRAGLRALGDEMTTIRDTLNKVTPTRTMSKNSLDQFSASSPSYLAKYAKIADLVNMSGPLTEDAVLKTVQARFAQEKYYTNIGPCLVAVNPHQVLFPSLALVDSPKSIQLYYICQDAIEQLADTGHSQTLLLNGLDGSGKSYLSQLLMRQLLQQTNADKKVLTHLQSALTVLRPMCHTHGIQRVADMGLYTQLLIEQGKIINFRLVPLFCSLGKVTIDQDILAYEIFQLVISGLADREKAKFHLEYYPVGFDKIDKSLIRRFSAWKTCLNQFGIHFADMMRILAALILLNDVSFIEGESEEPDVQQPNNELKSVAALLGISVVTLYKCLTSSSIISRGERQKNILTPQAASKIKQSLSRSLYVRMVKSVLQRINVFLNSCPNQNEIAANTKSGRVTSTEPFIGVLDMFGFQFGDNQGLESLCKNLAVETMHQHYTTIVFRNVLAAADEEGILQDVDINYNDNGILIDLISVEKEGLLPLLSNECKTQNPSAEKLLRNYNTFHKNHQCFKPSGDPTLLNFTINHYGSPVLYDASTFITENQDKITDDIIWAFSSHNCNFGFMSFLFSTELKSMKDGPKGLCYRVSPPDNKDLTNSTLCEDFLDNLNDIVKQVMQTKPHFIKCLNSNREGKTQLFDRQYVISQIRQHQILETVQLMVAGYSHKIRYKTFNERHKLLLYQSSHSSRSKGGMDETQLILDMLLKQMDEESKMPYESAHWAFGAKHLFFSESCRQQLERVRWRKKEHAAKVIQAQWKCRSAVKKWPSLKQQLLVRKQLNMLSPQSRLQSPIGNVQDISAGMQKIYLDQPPALPPSRTYSIQGNYKILFPQDRVMLQDFTLQEGNQRQSQDILSKGQEIKVTGYSDRRGCVKVSINSFVYHVPYQLTQTILPNVTPVTGVSI